MSSHGQLGDGSTKPSLAPELTTRLSGVTSVAAGGAGAMAIAQAPNGSASAAGSAHPRGLDQAYRDTADGTLTIPLPANASPGDEAIADIYTAYGEPAARPPGGPPWATPKAPAVAPAATKADLRHDHPARRANRPKLLPLPDGRAFSGMIVAYYGQDPRATGN